MTYSMFSSQRTSAGSFCAFSVTPCTFVTPGIVIFLNAPPGVDAEMAETGESGAKPKVLGLVETTGTVKAE